MTARTINTRATEHRNPSKAKGIYYHIHSCPNYLTRLAEFENTNFRPSDGVRARIKMRDKFFMQHFRVLQKSFGSYFDRRKSEAFFIRILRPDLNDQNDHRSFTLFWCGFIFSNKVITTHIKTAYTGCSKNALFFISRTFFSLSNFVHQKSADYYHFMRLWAKSAL